MQQITQKACQGCIPGPSRSSFLVSTGVCSRQHCSSLAPARLAARARLPHMDEELEHMQWQLDKRTHDRAAGAGHEHTSRHKPAKRRLVFHDSHSSQHHRHHTHHLHHQHRLHTRPTSASDSNSALDTSSGSSSSDEGGAAAPVGADLSHRLSGQQQQQQPMQAVCAGLQEEQFYCLHLDHVAGAQDLHKTQERLAKHIQQDGGCAVSAAVEQASMLTHLLLLLQHKQLHRKSGHWGDDMLLLLQPLSCEQQQSESPVSTPGNPAPAAAAAGLEDSMQAVSAAAAADQYSRSAAATRHAVSICPVDELNLFATFLPLHTLLSVERSSAADAVSAGAGTGEAQQMQAAPATFGGSAAVDAAATAASLQSWSAVESSCDDAAAAAGGHRLTNSNSSNGSSRHIQHSKSINELLKAAGGSAASALLSDAAQRGTLRCAHVGSHADAAGTAASIAAAVSAGQLLALHVKHQDAAHAVTYSALELAGRVLHGTAGQQGFGVLLVQGQSHEHVHARGHGHAHGHGSAGGGDVQQGAGAGGGSAAAAEAQQYHQQKQHGRVATDASMDVGGFGAAFYGLGGWNGDRSGQQQQGVQHRHGQEVWLCIVPLGVAS